MSPSLSLTLYLSNWDRPGNICMCVCVCVRACVCVCVCVRASSLFEIKTCCKLCRFSFLHYAQSIESNEVGQKGHGTTCFSWCPPSPPSDGGSGHEEGETVSKINICLFLNRAFLASTRRARDAPHINYYDSQSFVCGAL